MKILKLELLDLREYKVEVETERASVVSKEARLTKAEASNTQALVQVQSPLTYLFSLTLSSPLPSSLLL